jgi:chaperonin GroES
MTLNETYTEEAEGIAPAGTETQATIRDSLDKVNLADGMDEQKLQDISTQVSEGFDIDLESREHWEKNLEEWTDLALQVKEEKTFPWVGASNVKYPLLSTAALQFNARAYPSLIPSNGKVVQATVFGKDPSGEKLEKATRVGAFMSYQVLNQMHGWEEDMDRLLIMLPIIGTVFKKTYYNPTTKQNVSELVLPKNLVVNYWAKTLEDAERVSEIHKMSQRKVKEKQLAGLYLDIDLGAPVNSNREPNQPSRVDSTTPYEIIEQHTYLDLDDDGYSEPYVVTFERASKKVLRIAPRFDDEGITLNAENKVIKIDPIQYYTKFSFIPNPDGGFYDIGFGLLLSPLNDSVNTLINQLIDSGTINNLQGGFLGKGIKLKMGQERWTPGEWKTINSTADDLRKQIVPLPTKEPSAVLFQLMGTMVTSAKELASIAEIFVGKSPGQNTPATTTMATIEQGMKVFTAVYKRVYRSLKSEFKKIFELNKLYIDPSFYMGVVDQEIQPDDFDNSTYDICPGADPSTATQTEKLMKAQGLMELLPSGVLDPVKVVLRIMEAQEQPNFEELLVQEAAQTGQVTPPPDPKMLEMQMKAKMDEQGAVAKAQEMKFKSELAQRDQQFKIIMEAQKNSQEAKHKELMARIESASEIHKQRIFSAEAQQKMNTDAAMNEQKVRHGEQNHQMKMKQAKEQQASKNKAQKTSSPSGSTTRSRKG